MNHIAYKVLLVVLLSMLCSIAHADIVTLRDGTVIEGVVVKDTGAQVVIEITIANIKTTKTYPRYKVKSIEHKAIETGSDQDDWAPAESTDTKPENTLDSPKPTPSRATRSRAKRTNSSVKTRFIVIPVHGVIGEETNADGLEKALLLASRKKIEHIVFEIDSPGGYVYDAVETLKVLKKYDVAFVYHAFVEGGAISASSVYVASADDIWVRPDARVGGAVAYSEDNSSGAAEVDAKFNSIWAAEIAARAESKGYPGAIFRAMAVLEAEVWMDSDGKITSSKTVGSAQQIDSSSTILTIRAAQMVKAGMAKEFTGEIKDLGGVLDLNGWFEIKGIGTSTMQKSAKERESLAKRMKFAIDVFEDAKVDYGRDHPKKFNDYKVYVLINQNMQNRNFNNRKTADTQDAESLNNWRDRSRNSIADIDRMGQALKELADIYTRAEQIGALHLTLSKGYDDDTYKEIIRERSWLTKNMNKIPFNNDGSINYSH